MKLFVVSRKEDIWSPRGTV